MKDYTQVERDNAALTIREYAFGQMNMLRMLGDEDAANNLQEAINMAIAALRSGWVKTSERLPDGSEGKYLLVYNPPRNKKSGDEVIQVHVTGEIMHYIEDEFQYWLPLPPLPEVEE